MSVIEHRREDRAGEEIEIRLGDIVQILKDSRWAVLGWMIAFLLMGVLYAFSKPNEYTTVIRVMPELRGQSGGGGIGDLKSLAGLAGINLDNATMPEAIRPDLYPDIVQSIPFTLYLLNRPVTTTERKKPYSLQDFLAEQGRNTWIGQLTGEQAIEKPVGYGSAATSGPLQLTKLQEGLSKQLNQRVTVSIDKRSGIMLITSVMPDPMVAALVARHTLNHLANYVTNYRTGKSRQQVQFLNQQVNQARRRYQATEYAVSTFRDRNRNLFLNTARIEEQRLQADYVLAQTVYNELSRQLEQARIKVQEEVPVFEILEPARVPLTKSGPARTILTIGFTILGAIVGLSIFIVCRLLNLSNRSI